MLETVGLFEVRDRQSNKLSGGMKRRLGIAQALVGNPRILIVDEPTTGLDPEERLKFRNLMAEMSSKDIIIILSTHIVGDISSSCTNMAMLNKGELVYNGSPRELVERARGSVWLIEVLDSELAQIKEKYPVISTVPSVNGWEVQVLCENPDGYKGKTIEPNLEHAYVHFLEHELGESWNKTEF
ncbi:putative ABC transporter ATP-binding protein YxlF [subsurface metagenome]